MRHFKRGFVSFQERHDLAMRALKGLNRNSLGSQPEGFVDNGNHNPKG